MKPNWNNLNKLNQIGLETKLAGGKYAGEYVKDVVTWDADYVIYMVETERWEADSELLNLVHITQKQIRRDQDERELRRIRDEVWESIFGRHERL